MKPLIIKQVPTFKRKFKKLAKNQKCDVEKAIVDIAENPELGVLKTANLSGIRVYKFHMAKQTTLLAYLYDVGVLTLYLLDIGSHENFYRDLNR